MSSLCVDGFGPPDRAGAGAVALVALCEFVFLSYFGTNDSQSLVRVREICYLHGGSIVVI